MAISWDDPKQRWATMAIADQPTHREARASRSLFKVITNSVLVLVGIGLTSTFFVADLHSIGVHDLVAEQEAKNPTCISSWHKCKDNADLISNYRGMSEVRVTCMSAARTFAKYGDPKLPDYPFTAFRSGDADYLRTGIVDLTEPDAQLPNQYGIYVHAPIECQYDLNRKDLIYLNLVSAN
jgi:hypothetical protein